MTDPLASPPPARFRIFSLTAGLNRWFDRRARDAAFAELDDARLRDIGLSPEDIRRVRARVFW
jgi:uncharacterized protein YjiS (DUF1127 family)